MAQGDLSASGDESVTILHQSPAGVSMDRTKVYGVGPGGDACYEGPKQASPRLASPPHGVESSPPHQQHDNCSTLSALYGSNSPAPCMKVVPPCPCPTAFSRRTFFAPQGLARS
jgi:hypothetical protein